MLDVLHVVFSLLQVALAEKTAVLFTKDGDQHNNLHDMQCMWFVSIYFRTFYLLKQLFWWLLLSILCLYFEGMN